jgi:hypothetical protein
MARRIFLTTTRSGCTSARLIPRFQSWIVPKGTPDTLEIHFMHSPASKAPLIRATRASGCRIQGRQGEGQQFDFPELVAHPEGPFPSEPVESFRPLVVRLAKGRRQVVIPLARVKQVMRRRRGIRDAVQVPAKDASHGTHSSEVGRIASAHR